MNKIAYLLELSVRGHLVGLQGCLGTLSDREARLFAAEAERCEILESGVGDAIRLMLDARWQIRLSWIEQVAHNPEGVRHLLMETSDEWLDRWLGFTADVRTQRLCGFSWAECVRRSLHQLLK